ncbi:MAG: anti-sigma factor [Chloroflexi bacterium]|nr:anti-sigma factor [Chloroflexota bacterium]
MNQEDARTLIPLYALDLLDADEQAALEQVLASDSELRTELEQYHAIVDDLPLLVEARPAPDIRDKLQSRLQQSKRRTLWLRRGYWGAFAAAIILFVLTSIYLLAGVDDQDDRDEPTPDLVQEVLQDPESRAFDVSATDETASFIGRLTIDSQTEHAVLWVDGLQALDEQDYQLWFVKSDTERFDAGVFSVDEDNVATYLVDLPEDFESYLAAGVTIEPEGGSEDPTSDPILLVDLTQ